MNLNDLKPGDEVKNGRTGKWGKVDRCWSDGAGDVRRICVYRRVGPDQWHRRPTWWDADSITMVEVSP